MELSRVFLTQETLDTWLTSERVEIEQEELSIVGVGTRFQLKTAVQFLDEVAGGGDEAALIGKVHDLDQLSVLGGEHCADSVILGDSAYQVVEGFVAELVQGSEPDPGLRDQQQSLEDAASEGGEGLQALVRRLLAS